MIEGEFDDILDLAWARDVSINERRRAYRIFIKGNEAVSDGSFSRSAELYQQAIEIWDHPAFYYNLAVAQQNLGKPIEAYDSFGQAKRYGPRPIKQEWYEEAERQRDLLRSQLAEVEIICNEPGASIEIDGQPLFTAPGTHNIMVKPGLRRIRASKDGLDDDVQDLTLNPNDSWRITLAPMLPMQVRKVRRWRWWVPVAAAGASALVIGGGMYFDRRSSRAFDRFDEEFNANCTPAMGCSTESIPTVLQQQLEQGSNEQWLARSLYAVGGITAVTSAVLLYLNREQLLVERAQSNTSQGIDVMPRITTESVTISTKLTF